MEAKAWEEATAAVGLTEEASSEEAAATLVAAMVATLVAALAVVVAADNAHKIALMGAAIGQ